MRTKFTKIRYYKGRVSVKLNDSWVLRARYVMEKKLGRKLLSSEIVHHKNEVVDDDRPDNLRLYKSQAAHARYHAKRLVAKYKRQTLEEEAKRSYWKNKKKRRITIWAPRYV